LNVDPIYRSSKLAGVEAEQMINALPSEYYRSGVVGVHLNLTSRIEHINNLIDIQDQYSSATAKKAKNQFLQGRPDLTADLLHDVDTQTKTFDLLEKIQNKFRKNLARLDNKYIIDHKTKRLSKARKILNKYSVGYLNALVGHQTSARVTNLTEMLRKALVDQRVQALRTRILEELREAKKNGWYVVFDTLTLSDYQYQFFNLDKNALRNHFRNVKRLVEKRCGEKQCFKYICVPEYGAKEGRLHFHAIYLMKKLPYASFDPNVGRKTPDRREIKSLKIWKYGFSSPVACRYSDDAFTRLGWVWPKTLDEATGNLLPLQIKPIDAVAYYITKYASKNVTTGAKKCPRTKKTYRIRMSRKFGMTLPTLTPLSNNSLIQLTRLHHSVTPKAMMIKQHASAEIRLRLGHLSLKAALTLRKSRMNMLTRLEITTQTKQPRKLLNFIGTPTPALRMGDISDEVRRWVQTTRNPRTRQPLGPA